ncbi:nicolin-1-like isoform X2 [Periplaneta americana]|uniref:nicolin-1-like isoform X2 n=1 Tax=Periplaneta americana TaxID=6978 RepID=UPI0037E9511D
MMPKQKGQPLSSKETHPQRHTYEAVEYTVRGPVAVSLDDEVTAPGCLVIDLQFSSPTQVGELMFRNYYTAWLAVLIKKDTKFCAKTYNVCDYNGKQYVSATGNKVLGKNTKQLDDLGVWAVAIPRKTLMSNPHLEEGSQDLISISATESKVEWQNLETMRLILKQPSPVWKTFHIEEISLKKEIPRRVPRPIQHTDPVQCQYDTLLDTIRKQTIAALDWTPEQQKDSSTIKHGTSYEFFALPQL